MSSGPLFSDPPSAIQEEDEEPSDMLTSQGLENSYDGLSEIQAASNFGSLSHQNAATSTAPANPPRPGPSVLTGSSRAGRDVLEADTAPSFDAIQTNTSTDHNHTQTLGSSSSQPQARVPAAGVGTRTGPRPVPRSSSSLRHVSSRNPSSRGVSFRAVPEDTTADLRSDSIQDTGSAVQRKLDAEERKRRATQQRQELWAAESDDEDEDVGVHHLDQTDCNDKSDGLVQRLDISSSRGRQAADDQSYDDVEESDIPESRRRRRSLQDLVRESHGVNEGGAFDSNTEYDSSSMDEHEAEDFGVNDSWDESDHENTDIPVESHPVANFHATDAESADDLGKDSRAARYAAQEPGGPSLQGPRRAPWHPHGPVHNGEYRGDTQNRRPQGTSLTPQTPGLIFPASLNTPLEVSPGVSSPEMEPRQRLEWQTMLESVLASEVLRSETKRITSVDTPDLSRQELSYRRWLDIRASIRGRGHVRGAVEAEEKRLRSGWPNLLHGLIEATKACRSQAERESNATGVPTGKSGNLPPAPLSEAHEVCAEQDIQSNDEIFQEVGELLRQIDETESHFPSVRKAAEVVPEWGDQTIQSKVEALYAWHNITGLLKLQLRILREWTASETLEIDAPFKAQQLESDESRPLMRAGTGELEGMTFVERILKQDSLKSTFEKGTLESITKLVCKARETIKVYHKAFDRMRLPSFVPQLVELISFPMRLMQGAVRMRLDYAGKIKEPSLLIVDSLTDDLREALDVAIRMKRTYLSIMVPDPDRGWNLPPVIEVSYDEILRDALRFFFRLISFKLKGSIFFKETEILDTEWQFLSQAVEVIEGGDIIVAQSITKIVNKLFTRIIGYFKSELAAPSATKRSKKDSGDNKGTDEMNDPRQSSTHLGPTGHRDTSVKQHRQNSAYARHLGHLPVAEKIRLIHAVFDNVRVRSRKLLGFARDIRNRLDNAAEYDLASLRPPPLVDDLSPHNETSGVSSSNNLAETMDLNSFMQTLINADYFLVYTESYEERGIYIIAEPSLHDKPEVIQDLISKCVRKITPYSSSYASGGQSAIKPPSGIEDDNTQNVPAGEDHEHATTGPDHGTANRAATVVSPSGAEGREPPRYLLLLTPRDPFMWTGRVMPHTIEAVEVDLDERRLRLIADGPKDRLQLCKEHFYRIFTSKTSPPQTRHTRGHAPREEGSAAAEALAAGPGSAPSGFPLDVVNEHMAHMSNVQAELSDINKGVYMLSNTIIRAVPGIRRTMRAKHSRPDPELLATRKEDHGGGTGRKKSATESEELIQNCFSMAAEQGFRALPFIESARLRGFMTLSLARLAIDWVGFICDDCVPTDRKTFKWAVAALENAVQVTRNENIFHLSEQDFNLMRAKVASCVALLISHFDILGARSSVAKAKEEQERLEREKVERSKALENNIVSGSSDGAPQSGNAARLVQANGSGGANMLPALTQADSDLRATEERWVQKMIEWDEARHAIDAEQRLIGRVLDDTRLEDQGLQFLASSSSRVHIRWQQGRFVGAGTFGTVYLAVNLDSGGLMAVKEIRFQDISSTPSLYKQIKDEMNVMEMLSHPNIVEYYGIEVHRDKVYIFEEYCQGGSLAQLLEHGRIEDEAVIQVYTLQMLDGLVYLHSKGVVHRDIKPDNILLDHMGVIKFVDFGAAKVLAKNSRTIQRSRRAGNAGGMVGNNQMSGMVGPDGKPVGAAAVQSLQGTPMYMSPEVIKGENRGRRGAMDVWSLGCVVLEFATGRRPWSQLDNEWAIMFHIGMAQQHPPLPEPGQLSDLGIDFIRQCLMIDPYDRPSAMEMRQHPWIQNLVEQLDTQAEEEAALAAATGDTTIGAATPGVSSDFGQSSSTNTSYTPGPSQGENMSFGYNDPTRGFGGGGSSVFHHSTDSSAGIAAMVATPGTRSINGFNFQRPAPGGPGASVGGASNFSSWSKSLGRHSHSTVDSAAESTAPSSVSGQTDSALSEQPLGESQSSDAQRQRGPLSEGTLAKLDDPNAGHHGEHDVLPSRDLNEDDGHNHGCENMDFVGVPHHHAHGGYPAQVADLAWKEEEKLLHEMRRPLEQSGRRHASEERPAQQQT